MFRGVCGLNTALSSTRRAHFAWPSKLHDFLDFYTTLKQYAWSGVVPLTAPGCSWMRLLLVSGLLLHPLLFSCAQIHPWMFKAALWRPSWATGLLVLGVGGRWANGCVLNGILALRPSTNVKCPDVKGGIAGSGKDPNW